ncbi:MAG: hypothetical protein AVDCRST_MAG30-3248, partial [uncultured Solirubrobacteraceae bacterium]
GLHRLPHRRGGRSGRLGDQGALPGRLAAGERPQRDDRRRRALRPARRPEAGAEGSRAGGGSPRPDPGGLREAQGSV